MSLAKFSERLCDNLRDKKHAYDYVTEERGILPKTIDQLEIGYCDSDSRLALGVNLYGRITFPIHHAVSGDVIGFGGRIIPGLTVTQAPKYLNSPSSEVYDKSRSLYNLYSAQDYILEDGSAIVVEGYFDAAALWQAGIRNVVATCGTAVNKWHLRMLKRCADEVILLYDGDDAGVKAAEKAKTELASEMFPIITVNLGFDMDPDEFVRFAGGSAIRDLIDEEKGKQRIQ